MKIILYGGSGFIGLNLARFFSIDKNNEVLIVSRSSITYDFPENVTFASLEEFNLNIESHLVNFDYFFYLVNTILPRQKSKNLTAEIDDEKLRIMTVFNAAFVSNAKLKFVYFSSGGAVYGNYQNNPYKEFDPLKPLSCYGKLKLAGENEVMKLSKKYSIKSIVLRPSNVYGIGQSSNGKQGIVPFFTHQIMKKLPLTVFGDGEGKKDYIYIEDFVNAINCLILNNETGIFNIGSGYSSSVNEIISLIENNIGIKSTRKTIPIISHDVTNFSLDCSHFYATTSFKCKYSIREGIKQYIESLQSNL